MSEQQNQSADAHNLQPKPPSINPVADVFSALDNLSKAKRHELILPLLKKRCYVTQLLVGDDVSLRTTLASPDLYEREITQLVYNHLEYIDEDKPSFNNFLKKLSHIDRQVLIWGILKTSYNVLGEKESIKCPHCETTFTDKVTYDEVFQDDTITLWAEPQDFLLDRVETIETVALDNISEMKFYTKIPVIQDRINMMGLLGYETVKENFKSYGSFFTDSENLSVITDKIQVTLNNNPVDITTMQEIHITYTQYIPHAISKKIQESYDKKYNKYAPFFRKPYTCGKCKKEFDYVVDPEINLYQTFFGTTI